MLTGAALCFVAMFACMFLLRDGHGPPMCSFRWPHDTTRTDITPDTPAGTFDRTADSSERGPHDHCRELMRNRCGASAGCQPE